MTQSEIVTNISKFLFGKVSAEEYRVSELLGFMRRRDASFVQKLSAGKKFSSTAELAEALKSVYSMFNPKDYDRDTVIIWVYVEEHALGALYIGFSRELTVNEWDNIRRVLRVDYVDIKPGNFGILTF
jgi:hypothetical protein